MADGTQLNPGTGGDTIYTDDIAAGSAAGMKVQGVKIGTGANGSWTEVGTSNPVPVSDAGGSLTVDGTVAVSGTVPVSDGGSTISVDDGAGSLTVDGTVTANAGTGPWPVTDNGGSLTVDGTVGISGTVATTLSGSPTVDTELTTADLDTGAGTDTRAVVGLALAASGGALLVGSANPVPVSDNSGSLTVDNGGTFAVQATLQAGSAAVGKLAANDGVDIGDVTINNASGAAAVNIQDGGNSITVDGTVGVSGTVAVTDNSGSLTVDNGGTFAVQDSQVITDNAGFTDGTSKVFPTGYILDEVAGTALTENDIAAARIDSKRAQVGVIEDATTRGQRAAVSAAGALKVDGSAVTQPVSGTVTANPASGTITTVQTVTALTGGGVAHDGADSGNPVKVGGRARTTDITAVASDDRTDFIADTLGRQVVAPYAIHENLISGGTGGTPLTNTTSTSMISAQAAGVRSYITSLTVTNGHASVGTVVQIRDGSGGTILWEGYCAPNGGGASPTLPTPLRGSAATAVHAVCVTTGASVTVAVSGYKSAV